MVDRVASERSRGGYMAVLAFSILTAGATVAHGSSALNYLYPSLATALALYLFVSYRTVYIGFVWWIWLFSPLVRRLVDWHTHYHKVSPIILTPILVSLVAVIFLSRNPSLLLRRSLLPFLLILIVYLIALVVGVLTNGVGAFFDFANSIAPLGFCLFLMCDAKNFINNRDSLVSAMIIGLPLISLYGLYQFFSFPPWDLFWLKQSNFSSAGTGLAEQTRLFGTLNAPGPFSQVLMASLVFTLVVKGPLKVLGSGLGFPVLGLSLVRASWGGWLVSALYVFFRLRGKARSRLIFFGFVAAAIAFPLVTVGPVAQILTKRFATFSNIQQDHSFQTRKQLYEDYTLTALSQPIGVGFGGVGGQASKLNGQGAGAGIDSGVLVIPYQFGWLFGPVFTWSLLMIALGAVRTRGTTLDQINIAGAGVYFSMLLLTLGTYVFSGPVGLITWVSAAFALGPIQSSKSRRLSEHSAKFTTPIRTRVSLHGGSEQARQ